MDSTRFSATGLVATVKVVGGGDVAEETTAAVIEDTERDEVVVVDAAVAAWDSVVDDRELRNRRGFSPVSAPVDPTVASLGIRLWLGNHGADLNPGSCFSCRI